MEDKIQYRMGLLKEGKITTETNGVELGFLDWELSKGNGRRKKQIERIEWQQ